MQTPWRVPQVRQGIVLLAPVTPGRGEDFLENVARPVWRRREVGSRPARKLQKEGHGCVRGAASPSGARTEAQDGNWKWGWTQARGSSLHGVKRTTEGLGAYLEEMSRHTQGQEVMPGAGEGRAAGSHSSQAG